jgi:hypothetical protein
VVLDLVPDYDVYQSIYGQMDASTYQPLELLFDHWDALLNENDSLSVFPDWATGDLGMVVTRSVARRGRIYSRSHYAGQTNACLLSSLALPLCTRSLATHVLGNL